MSDERTEAENNLSRQRAARDKARAGFVTRVEKLREDLTPNALASRVIDDLTYKSRGLAGQALEIASDNRGVVVGTVVALAMWAARRPMGRGIATLAGRLTGRKPAQPKEPIA